jgi:hypothetical protein
MSAVKMIIKTCTTIIIDNDDVYQKQSELLSLSISKLFFWHHMIISNTVVCDDSIEYGMDKCVEDGNKLKWPVIFWDYVFAKIKIKIFSIKLTISWWVCLPFKPSFLCQELSMAHIEKLRWSLGKKRKISSQNLAWIFKRSK